MQINNYKQKAADYAKHSRAEGTLSLAYKEFGRIFEKYLTSNGNKALDFGTGVGRSRNYLEEVGFDADGVDIDESMLNKAKELDPKNKNKYKLINNKIVPQRASYYDLIFSSLVILEMESREEIAHYFREALRVMKFDGTFIALTVNDDFYQHPWVSIDTSYPGNKEAQSGDRVRIKIKEINMELDDFCWTKQDLRAIAIESGFTILEEVEPKAPSYEQAEWISECEYSPYVIFVMKKTESLRTHRKNSKP